MTTTIYKVYPNPKPLIDVISFITGPPSPLNEDQRSVNAQLIVDCRCQLGECILWDDLTQEILFISILDKTFHKLNTMKPDVELETYLLPKMIGAFALLENPPTPNTFLVGWEDGFQLYDVVENRPLSEMSIGESVNPLGLPDRLNDGRVDPTGRRFICGGCMGNSRTTPLKVYKCEYNQKTQQLEHEAIVDTIQTTNSICWSLDGKTMYLANSPDLKIHQYEYDLTSGTVSNKRHLHNKISGFADGSCIDSEGYIWNATWRQGKGIGYIDRICPQTGKTVFQVHLPDNTSEASCCCFGGPDLDILFITTAWEHLDPSTELHAGGLYAVKLPKGISGLPEKRFRL